MDGLAPADGTGVLGSVRDSMLARDGMQQYQLVSDCSLVHIDMR